MPKLEDLLKAKGYTDSDIQALAPMLADQRFRDSIESSVGAVETERDQFKAERDTYENWRETVANPHIANQEKIAAAARLEAATAREEAKIARELGLFPEDKTPKTPATPDVSGTFDPKAHNLVTREDFESGYAKFADAEGRAIAMANDLSAEYSHLTGGKSLYEYVSQDGKQRGMTALREEAVRLKQPLDQYVATKFNFNQLRQQAADAAQKAHDDKIREEERGAMAAKYGNPMLRTPMPSRQPFIPQKTGDSKQPWELTQQEKRNNRLNNALKSQFTGSGQPN